LLLHFIYLIFAFFNILLALL